MFGPLRFFCSLLFVAGIIEAFPDPMSCSGVCGNAHDPSILQNTDGTYYRFSTGGGISIHTSPSLTGPWTYQGHALGASAIDGNTDLWVRFFEKHGISHHVSVSKHIADFSTMCYHDVTYMYIVKLHQEPVL